jgi:hypothetical protein
MAPGTAAKAVAVLRCSFRTSRQLQRTLAGLNSAGIAIAIARRNGETIILTGQGGLPLELPLKSEGAAPFLSLLSGDSAQSYGGTLYDGRPVPGTDWIAAGAAQQASLAGPSAATLERARLISLLALAFLAGAAVFLASALTGPMKEAGRQAAALLETCGAPPMDKAALREPAAIAGAMETAASLIKQHSFRDLELETETEKLREEEADLKSQNDELEKLNKYLMEREVKISELKKEISDLREKVGGGV